MKKVIWAIVPVCITFGPLFMTRIAGTARADIGHRLEFSGVMMLAVGLVIIFRVITSQQKLIDRLLSEKRNNG